MSEKPIMFNSQMVRAIQGGAKTQTRRIVKGYIPRDAQFGFDIFTRDAWTDCIACRGYFDGGQYGEKFFKLPYMKGDELYVRESYAPDYYDGLTPGIYNGGNRNLYKADHPEWDDLSVADRPAWIPAVHMPKKDARIWLLVKSITVQRLQAITEEDAQREGANYEISFCDQRTARHRFAAIWNQTIKAADRWRYAWNANPFVWVMEFERMIIDERTK